MCGPGAMAAAQFGIGALQSVAQFKQQQEAYAANKAQAELNYRFQMKGLQEKRTQENENFALRHQQIALRTGEEAAKSTQIGQNLVRKGAVQRGKIAGQIGKRKITGTTAEAIMRDVQRANLEEMTAAIRNGEMTQQNLQYQNFLNIHKYENLQTQMNLSEEGYGYQMQAQINSVNNPDTMSLLLGIAGAGVKSAGTYKQFGGQWGGENTDAETQRLNNLLG